MWKPIPEADWKVFRQFYKIWLDRYCTSVNEEMKRLLARPGWSSHERYLKAYRFMHDKDKELGAAFNDFRRSTAELQISIIMNLGVITDEELARFSEPTRNSLLGKWE